MKTKVHKTLSFFVALCLVAAGFFIKYQAEKSASAQRTNDAFTRELNTLCNSLSNIGAELEKAQYITTAPLFCETAAKAHGMFAPKRTVFPYTPYHHTKKSRQTYILHPKSFGKVRVKFLNMYQKYPLPIPAHRAMPRAYSRFLSILSAQHQIQTKPLIV
jgi:hypothetical protein